MKIKNLKINKKTLVLISICSLTLLNGCTNQETKELSQLVVNAINNPKSCTHLTIIFDNETITFKECDGYNISTNYLNKVDLEYKVYLNNLLILDGNTNFYNKSNVYHENIEKLDKEKILIKY